MSQPTQTKPKLPPTDACRVYKWTDLPPHTKRARYRVTNKGQEPKEISVARHQRQALEGLMRSPLYAASYCRLSDQVLPLRRDQGIDIECEMYSNDAETGRQRYGVYFLKSKVERIEDAA